MGAIPSPGVRREENTHRNRRTRGARRRRTALCHGLALLALLCAALGVAPSARAHDMGADSVDCTAIPHCEIRWKDFTRFDTARRFAIGEWSRLGRVDIVPDTAFTINDLRFVDYSDCDVRWEGFWTADWGADVIGFNPCKIGRHAFGYPPDARAVAVHELGHALRLAHPTRAPSEYWRTRSIMYRCARCTPFSTYRAHDVNDYRARW